MNTVAKLKEWLMETLVMSSWILALIFFIGLGFVYMVLILPSHVLVTKMRKLEENWLKNFLEEAIAEGDKVVIQTKLKDSKENLAEF